jgi:hypothetical protein
MKLLLVQRITGSVQSAICVHSGNAVKVLGAVVIKPTGSVRVFAGSTLRIRS